MGKTVNMDQLNTLSKLDFPNTIQNPSGYEMETVVICSDENFRLLIKEHNKMVKVVNDLLSPKPNQSFGLGEL